MENDRKMYFNYGVNVNAVLFVNEVNEEGEVVSAIPVKAEFESIEDLVITIRNTATSDKEVLVVALTTNPRLFLRGAQDQEILFSSFTVDEGDLTKEVNDFCLEIEKYILESLAAYARAYYEIDVEEGKFERIRIYGLFGKYDVSIKIMDNIVILIGANGVGKSTIIRFIDCFLNQRFSELIKIPFDYMDYMLFDDVSNIGDIRAMSIITGLSSEDFVPTEEYLIDKYEKIVFPDIQMPNYEDFIMHDDIFDVSAVDRFKEFIHILKEEKLYIQFINVLLYKTLPSPRLNNIISRFLLLKRFIGYDLIQVKQYQNAYVIDGSPISEEIMAYRNGGLYTPRNSMTFYIDMVQNLMLDEELINESFWRNNEIEWITQKERQISTYKSIFDIPEVYSIEYDDTFPITDYMDTRPTPICKARPELDFGIDNYPEVYRKVVTQEFDENNIFYSEIGTRMGVGNAQKMVYIDEILRLIRDRKFNINKLINVYFCKPDIIHKVNKLSQKYTIKYFVMLESIYNEPFDTICKSVIRELKRFQKYYLNDYSRYINPILVKNSFFYVDTRKLASKKNLSFYKMGEDSIRRHSSGQGNYFDFYFGHCRHYDAYKIVYEDYCFIKQLNEFAKRVIPILKDDSSKTDRINYFEDSLRKYFVDKNIVISPNGLSIYASVSSTEENCSVTIYDKDEINLAVISSGEKKIITLFALASFFTNIMILLDEPELSLSIVWQEMLMKDLAENLFGNRIIIATHSPYLIKDPAIQDKVIYLPQAKMEHEDE